MVGELSPEIILGSGIFGDEMDAADDDNENMIWKESEACIEGHLDCGALFYFADPRTVVLDFEPRLSVQTTRWRVWPIITKLLACAHLSMGPLV